MKRVILLPLCLALVLCFNTFAMAAGGTINVYNWSEYIPQEVLNKFTEETGIKIIYTTYESNEAMFAKVKLLDGKGYDIVVPSTYFVTLMRNSNLLATIDKSKIPNMKNLEEVVMGQEFDPKNDYSIPYMWGVQGFMVNKNAVDPKEISSWNDLMREEFKGKLLLSDDLRDTFGAALKATGSSINSKNPEEIKKAFDWLTKLKPSVRIFDVTAAKQALISEEVMAGMIWNGDAFIAKNENPNLTFIYPKDGAPLWVDSFVIPAGANNPDGAHAFINFMLRPDIAALCVQEYNYTTPNKGVRALLDKEFAESNLIFPSETDLVNSEFTQGLGETRIIYERYWEDLKINN